jgi:ATP-dependent Clp protease ATP-binding subunit ClpA
VFERFTAGARAVVFRAQDRSRALDHRLVATPHLLLGLLDGACGNLLRRHGVTAATVQRELDDLLRRDPDVAADDAAALAALGIDLDRIRAAVEATFGPGALDRLGEPTDGDVRPGPLARLLRRGRPPTPTETEALRLGGPGRGRHLPFSPSAKKSLELALREAIRLKDGELREGHLLLGLLRGADGAAAAVLDRLQVDPAGLRADVEAQLDRERRRSA